LFFIVDDQNSHLASFLGDDVQIDVGCGSGELLNGEEVQVLLQAGQRRTAEDRLRDAVLCRERSRRQGNVRTL